MIGRIDARTEEITRFPMPRPEARDPHTIAFNSKGELWFTLQQRNMVGRLDPTTGRIWFGTDRNTVGYAQVRPAGLRP